MCRQKSERMTSDEIGSNRGSHLTARIGMHLDGCNQHDLAPNIYPLILPSPQNHTLQQGAAQKSPRGWPTQANSWNWREKKSDSQVLPYPMSRRESGNSRGSVTCSLSRASRNLDDTGMNRHMSWRIGPGSHTARLDGMGKRFSISLQVSRSRMGLLRVSTEELPTSSMVSASQP